MIQSPYNSRIKLIRALSGKPRDRRENSAFVAEGVRLIEDALSAGWSFQFVLFSEDISNRGKKLVENLLEAGVIVEEVLPSILRAACETENSQGIAAVLKLPELSGTDLPAYDFVLIPDQMRDPGNLGTLIRSAAAAGVQAVYIPPETTDPFAPKVVRAGMGAHFRIPIFSMSWEEIKNRTAGLTIAVAGAEGNSDIWNTDFRTPLALIIGGEAEGASVSARDLANIVVNIPMTGKIESLNAGAAGAVIMFEVVRQRREVQ